MERSLVQSRTTVVKENPITQCNVVIVCYNTPFHMVRDTELSPLPNNKLYKNFYPFLVFPRVLLLLVTLFVPLINLAELLACCVLWGVFENALCVYKKNARLIPDVFEKMIYSPEHCQRNRRSNMFVSIHVDQFSNQDRSELEHRRSEDHYQFMVYNDQFKRWYTRFPRYRYLHLSLSFIAICIVALCYLVLYPLLLMECKDTIFSCRFD